jgi:hypothetical protein
MGKVSERFQEIKELVDNLEMEFEYKASVGCEYEAIDIKDYVYWVMFTDKEGKKLELIREILLYEKLL